MNLYLEFSLFCSFLLCIGCLNNIQILKGGFRSESN